jgi:hypothetical protein
MGNVLYESMHGSEQSRTISVRCTVPGPRGLGNPRPIIAALLSFPPALVLLLPCTQGALAVTRRIVEFFRAKPTLVGTAEAVVNLSGRDKFVTVPSSASLLQVLGSLL